MFDCNRILALLDQSERGRSLPEAEDFTHRFVEWYRTEARAAALAR